MTIQLHCSQTISSKSHRYILKYQCITLAVFLIISIGFNEINKNAGTSDRKLIPILLNKYNRGLNHVENR